MRTLTIDILHEKALNLLKDLELLTLIKIRHDNRAEASTDWSKYKGAMSKQSLEEVNLQLNELRSEWD